MSVRPIGKNKWQIDYYPQGRKGKRVRVTFQGTQSEAQIFEMELRRQNSGLRNPINPKIADIIPEFLEWYKLHKSPRTYLDATNQLKWLLPFFGKYQVSRLTPSIIDQYKIHRTSTPHPQGFTKHKAINNELTCLSAIIHFMVDRSYANQLPFKIEKFPYKRPLPQIPPIQDIQKLLAEINDPMKKAMVLLMLNAGLRWKEVRLVRWENLNWADCILHLTETKGSHPRFCILNAEVKDILGPNKQNKGWIFANPKTGEPYTTLKTLFKLACRRAGIKKIHPHLLRHTFGTNALDATGDLRLVQKLLGHKQIDTTQLYTQVATRRIKEGMQKISDYTSQLKRGNKA